jgi:hypothetical protein
MLYKASGMSVRVLVSSTRLVGMSFDGRRARPRQRTKAREQGQTGG